MSGCALLLSVCAGVAYADDWPMFGGSPDRNLVSPEKGIPASWNVRSKTNVKWVVSIGTTTYGNPVIADGRIFVSTNNGAKLRPEITGDKGILLCLKEATGELLWQATHDKLPTGAAHDWPEQGIASTPWVDGDRLYYVSNRCQLVCADVHGFLDGENDGPFTSEQYHHHQDVDIIWSLDMMGDLKVFPHNLANSSPVGNDKLVFVATSNGVDDSHRKMPSPNAPDLIAVSKRTGKVIWSRNDAGKNVFHGQWSSPALGTVRGNDQLVFAGGDGWCYAYEPETGKPIWKFNLNPKGTKGVRGGRATKNSIIATPVIYDNKVFLAVGQDPEHGDGPGRLCVIDATKKGDVTDTGLVWAAGGERFHRSLSTVAIANGLVYAADLAGFLCCFDAATGESLWQHDTFSAIWGSPLVVDGKVMLGTTDGEVHVLRQGRTLKELFVNDLISTVYTTPVAANGVLYIATSGQLIAIARD